jgi:hypothetical protein
MQELFEKTIFTTGRCTLSIKTPMDKCNNTSGVHLLADGDSMEESEITPRLLHMLAEAYYAGYREATHDATEATRKLLVDSKQHRKPKAKISSCVDHRPPKTLHSS